jgi:hypothetical protein
MPLYRSLFAASLGLAALDVHAASLAELLNAVPPPPGDVPTALRWTQNGQIVAPEYTRFKQALEAERAAVMALAGGRMPTLGAPISVTADTPEVQAAVRGYNAYVAANSGEKDVTVVLAERTRWVQGAMGGQQASATRKMKPCPLPCQDPAIAAHNQPLLDKKARLADEEIRMWNALFPDWRRGRAGMVNSAQLQIAATGEGAAATTPEGRAAVAAYRAAMLKEIELTLSITETAVRRAAAIEASRSGVMPDGLTGASKKAN